MIKLFKIYFNIEMEMYKILTHHIAYGGCNIDFQDNFIEFEKEEDRDYYINELKTEFNITNIHI